MIASKNDTVFFLGAGFSKAAGAPLQSEILSKVLDFDGSRGDIPVSDYKIRLKSFLKDAFYLDENQCNTFNLEDFYTPIDKCINDNISFRGYPVQYIQQIRNELSTLIGIVINSELERNPRDNGFLDSFSEFIVKNSVGSRNKKKYSIITTNWDIVLDRRIFQLLSQEKKPTTIDFGTHVTGLGSISHDQITPTLTVLSKGGSTVKLYKIHGSLNWLKCPSCDRLYVNKQLKVGIINEWLDIKCRFCNKQFILPVGISCGFKLQPQIIYPTFLKDLQTTHFTNIWNSVSRDLSETKRLVFIGYSFQQADFEIRQLLARRLPDDCEIINVGIDPELNEGDVGYVNSSQSRYKNFFGKRKYTYFSCGVKDYVLNHLN